MARGPKSWSQGNAVALIRLESFQEIARKTGRELVVMAKDIYMLHNLQCVGESCRTEGLRIYDEIGDKSRRKWEQEVVLPVYRDRYVDHASLRESPDSYILCFSFFDSKHLLDIKPEGGTYIYSACEAFNEEIEIYFRRLWQWLRRFGIDLCGFLMNEGGDLAFEKRYHAPGHASGEDIIWAYRADRSGLHSADSYRSKGLVCLELFEVKSAGVLKAQKKTHSQR